MSKTVNRQVINGRLVVTQTRRTPEDGYHVQSLVYASDTQEGEPVSDWALPYSYRYDLDYAALVAERQTPRDTPGQSPVQALVERQRKEAGA